MKENICQKLKKITPLKLMVIAGKTLHNKYGLFSKSKALLSFFKDCSKYKSLANNKNFLLSTSDLYPRLFDNTKTTKVDPVYFYQNTWCAKKIFEAKPTHHYDVGSSAEFIGIVSQFVSTTMVDIRPLPVSLPSLFFKEGSILKLPFADKSLSSLSSICVIEHIGLGRYGDPLDPFGSEKAAKELSRILARGGSLYISVPIDSENKVYFNAHRAFTRNYALELFDGLKLEEEKYIYGNTIYDAYDPRKGFGTGLYHFKKI